MCAENPNSGAEPPDPGIDRYRGKIVYYLRKRVPSHQVDDFAQETLLNVHAHISKGHTLENPLAYLYRTASNVVSAHYRDQKMAALTDTVVDIDTLGLEYEAPSAERSATAELEFEAMCVAIARLPEKCRKAFVLRKVYQYSYKEIAEYSGISVNTAKTYVRRGFKQVHAYYEERHGLELP